jgi:hypothetical protein
MKKRSEIKKEKCPMGEDECSSQKSLFAASSVYDDPIYLGCRVVDGLNGRDPKIVSNGWLEMDRV